MGSATSRHHRTGPNRAACGVAKRALSSVLLCGGRRHTSGPEDYPAESLVNSAEYCGPVVSKCQGLGKEPVLSSGSGSGLTSSETECGVSSGSSDPSSEESSERRFRNDNSSFSRKCISEINELGSSHVTNPESYCYLHTNDVASSSSTGPSVNEDSNNSAAVVDNDSLPQTTSGVDSRGSCLHNEEDSKESQGVSCDEDVDGVRSIAVSDAVSPAHLLGSGTGFPSLGDDDISFSSEAVVPDSAQEERREEIPHHVSMVSISSGSSSGGNEESNAREVRRHGRRMFWDSFSSRSSRRRSDFSTMLLATEETDSVGSRRRWLIDFGGDLIDGGNGGDSYFSRRSHIGSERWWRSRSQLLDRLRGGTGETGLQTTCPLGLHPDGSCSCDADEDTGTRASISRVVMLAEALFEVLDEIHRQPSSFSLSMLSRPAPESVVDTFPLRSYKKPNALNSGEDVDQCYICLAEYEDEDKIRVLPCHHEYHMSCVDKWLKEIHGVCPLCRGDVCEKSGELTNSNVSPSA